MLIYAAAITFMTTRFSEHSVHFRQIMRIFRKRYPHFPHSYPQHNSTFCAHFHSFPHRSGISSVENPNHFRSCSTASSICQPFYFDFCIFFPANYLYMKTAPFLSAKRTVLKVFCLLLPLLALLSRYWWQFSMTISICAGL